MFKSSRKITIFILCGVMLLGLLTPMVVQADSIKKVKKIAYTAYSEDIEKQATIVKKGTNTLSIKKMGWVKFKAPKKRLTLSLLR